ncbi:hypothetical protein PHYPSEUDO_002273 [Phytophthora pseudosyringae]|uniref:Transmembrane protein n=1 Tax=Phytophthora pseudosyringae TaxID=221518 RepID=A0A8T1VYS0_9STRA|nr:hypothetical protein PHYPSEUDO_002273 [Phytophthora pseudosyringae]
MSGINKRAYSRHDERLRLLSLEQLTIQFSSSPGAPDPPSSLNVSKMMSSMSSEQYEVMHTMRSEMFAKKEGQGPQRNGPPRGFGPWCGGPRGFGRASWMDVTPAERDVFVKYRQKGTRRAAFGGLLGAAAMAGIWNAAALGTPLGVVGVLVGGAIGARTSMSSSSIRTELFTELLQLPGDNAPHAAQAREILQSKLSHNAYAQELLKGAGLPTQEKPSAGSFKDK